MSPSAAAGHFAKGELLDWRQMVARYPEAEHVILEGSDHALSDFETHISRVLDFWIWLELRTPQPALKTRAASA